METGSHGVRTQREGHVLTLAIDRPAVRNALDVRALEELSIRLEADASHGDVRVVVLRGLGDAPFSAGYDLGGIGAGTVDSEGARRLQEPIRRLATSIMKQPKPVVAAVRRFAIGAALDIVAHCDVRVAEESARFRLPAAHLGFVYPFEGVDRLKATLGRGRAERLFMLADDFGATELAGCGFLHRVWPAAAFEAGLAALLQQLAGLAPLALRGFKELLSADTSASADPISLGYRWLAESLNSHDAREGVAAAKEKRPPQFSGQ